MGSLVNSLWAMGSLVNSLWGRFALKMTPPTSNFLPSTCKFATLIYQILGSEMSVRAPPLLSPYVFVLLLTNHQPLTTNNQHVFSK